MDGNVDRPVPYADIWSSSAFLPVPLSWRFGSFWPFPFSKESLTCWLLVLFVAGGCTPLRPRAITADQYILSDELQDGNAQIQRGKPRKVIDVVGWVIGIPSKITLWNRRIDNHNISPATEMAIQEYLVTNGLDTTRVRLNQYAPLDDWRRLVRNKRVGAPWRYTFGAINTLYETVLPGRLIGGDHYNPFTDTIHIYSDVPGITLHEAAHAKDFARRKWKGTYAAVYILPGVPLYHESIASGDALAYSEMYRAPAEQKETINVLYPAYSTYVGGTLGTAVPEYSNPLYYGSVLVGHVWGRTVSRRIQVPVARSAEAAPLGSYPPLYSDEAELGTLGSEAAVNSPPELRSIP